MQSPQGVKGEHDYLVGQDKTWKTEDGSQGSLPKLKQNAKPSQGMTLAIMSKITLIIKLMYKT